MGIKTIKRGWQTMLEQWNVKENAQKRCEQYNKEFPERQYIVVEDVHARKFHILYRTR